MAKMKNHDGLRDIEQRLHALEMRIRQLKTTPDVYFRVFDAELDGSDGDTGMLNTWHEVIDDGGSMVTFGDRLCDDPADSSAAIEINGWEWIPAGLRVRMIETEDVDGMRYEFLMPIPPPPLQDGSTDYILGYDSASQQMKWVATSTACPGGGG